MQHTGTSALQGREHVRQKGRAVYRSAPEMISAVDAVLSEGLSKAEWTALHKALLKLGEHVRSLNEGDAE